MKPPHEHNIRYFQPTDYYPKLYYQRIDGRLQRVEAVPRNTSFNIINIYTLPRPANKEKEFSKSSQSEFYPYCIGGLVTFLLCIFLGYSIFPYPLHASCTVKWSFGEPCNHVIQRLRWQILKWSSYHNCGPQGSRCLYYLKNSANNNSITAMHISPNLKLSNNIRISFAEGRDKSCIATGKSESNEWFVMFDYGSNYCNLRNLVEGANFVTDHGFMEITTDSICTQFNMVVCK